MRFLGLPQSPKQQGGDDHYYKQRHLDGKLAKIPVCEQAAWCLRRHTERLPHEIVVD